MVGIGVQPMKYAEYDGDDYNGHCNEIKPKGTVIFEWKEVLQWNHIYTLIKLRLKDTIISFLFLSFVRLISWERK